VVIGEVTEMFDLLGCNAGFVPVGVSCMGS